MFVWRPEEERSYSTTLPYSLETGFLGGPGPRPAAPVLGLHMRVAMLGFLHEY